MALGKGLSSLIPQQKTARKVIRKETSFETPSNADRVWQIPLSEIIPNSEQPRKHFSHADLEDLVASIKKHGILQPITVTEREDGGYELIAGERRFRSSQIAGLATVPALVRTATQQERLELALIENIQRQNLNPVEEGFAYRRLMDEFGLTQEDVASQVGKKRPTVANMIRLLDLPEVVQKSLMEGKISAGKARALLSLRTEEERLDVFESMMGEKMSVREVEAEVAAKKMGISRKGSVRRDVNIRAQEEIIEDRLGTKVTISGKGEKGKIVIAYYSAEELRRIVEELS